MGRLIPGLIMGAGCLGLLIWGASLVISLVITVVAALALRELFAILLPELKGVAFGITFLATLLPCIGAFFGSLHALIGAFVMGLLCIVLISFRWYTPFTAWFGQVYTYLGSSVFALTYISLLLGHLILTARLTDGSGWLIVLLALTAGSDTGAYYAGKNFGKSKLCPIISPKKTVEGLLGGVITGSLAAAVAVIVLFDTRTALFFLPACIVLILIGVCGDLTESIIKRSFQIKDSGTILGGHGGILDRIDSLLLSGPILYYLLQYGVIG
ncbi:phosphatidate cytidylyltransferase [Desulfogranum japonicum]|uniref:phosphatidate cytidylyltransferase n=1 Tax=Desulfogranum japonicum TaxID=231447 RepID=UPI00041F65F0|nr:phosphatidate cytidylyltransferase [Desulfogranum japonicum]